MVIASPHHPSAYWSHLLGTLLQPIVMGEEVNITRSPCAMTWWSPCSLDRWIHGASAALNSLHFGILWDQDPLSMVWKIVFGYESECKRIKVLCHPIPSMGLSSTRSLSLGHGECLVKIQSSNMRVEWVALFWEPLLGWQHWGSSDALCYEPTYIAISHPAKFRIPDTCCSYMAPCVFVTTNTLISNTSYWAYIIYSPEWKELSILTWSQEPILCCLLDRNCMFLMLAVIG